MTDKSHTSQSSSRLSGPPVNPKFRSSLDELVALAHQGQSSQSEVYNPSDDWLTTRMPILDDLPQDQQAKILEEEECQAKGMGAYLAVTQGSDLKPKFIHLIYLLNQQKILV